MIHCGVASTVMYLLIAQGMGKDFANEVIVSVSKVAAE
jgi:hypothetical protein